MRLPVAALMALFLPFALYANYKGHQYVEVLLPPHSAANAGTVLDINNEITGEPEVSSITTSSSTANDNNRALQFQKVASSDLSPDFNVDFCVPHKVASSSTIFVFRAWKKVTNATTTTTNGNDKTKAKTFRYSIIRDPLERLYSGYWNKCLHQPIKEKTQCPNFPRARRNPPTFEQWLQSCNTPQGKLHFHNNVHFRAMSKQCNLQEYDKVYHLSSPTFNQDMNTMWKQLGAPQDVVKNAFPVEKPRTLSWYHSNATATARDQYNCRSLALALPLLQQDYFGSYKNYFPFPDWVQPLLEGCQEAKQKVEELRKETRRL